MGLKLLYISSSQRDSYYDTSSNNFRYICNESMYGGYRLKAVSVPNTVYTIESGVNNQFFVRLPTLGPTWYTVNMPNYYISDGNTLAILLQNTLNLVNPAITANPFVMSYDNYTSKIQFSNATQIFDLSFNRTNSLGNILGFAPGVYSSSALGPPAILRSLTIVNLTRTAALFITIKEFNNYLQNARTGKNYTFMLPNNVSSLYFIDSFFDQTGILNQFAKELNISIVDENDRLVDLQNVDWYMVLESIC
jgi:hypothetical protein